MNLVEKYNIKFTMYDLLRIEREFDMNLLDGSLIQNLILAEQDSRVFFNKEVKPFLDAMGDKELNESEVQRRDELNRKARYLKHKENMAKYYYYFEILNYFTDFEAEKDLDIDLESLIEFYKEYTKATDSKFNIPKKSDDTGLTNRNLKELGGTMLMRIKNVICR